MQVQRTPMRAPDSVSKENSTGFFPTRFSAVIVAHSPERMTVAEGAVLQQVVLLVNLVQLQRDVATLDPRFDQLHAAAMNLAVDLP